MGRHTWVAFCALIVVAGLAGCAPTQLATHSMGQHEPKPDNGKLSVSAVDLATRSGTWPSTQEILETAANWLARRCMAEHGFDLPPTPEPSLPSPEGEEMIINLPSREAHGYGIVSTPDAGTTPEKSATDTFYRRLSPQEQQRFTEAFFGPPNSKVSITVPGGGHISSPNKGCMAESRRILIGDVTAWARAYCGAENFSNKLTQQISTSAEYDQAISNWRTCMAGKGMNMRRQTRQDRPRRGRTKSRARQNR